MRGGAHYQQKAHEWSIHANEQSYSRHQAVIEDSIIGSLPVVRQIVAFVGARGPFVRLSWSVSIALATVGRSCFEKRS